MSELTAWISSRNSSGVEPVSLTVSGDVIVGYRVSKEGQFLSFTPPARLTSLEDRDDWRTANMHLDRDAAIRDYIALERSRIREAEKAIKAVRAAHHVEASPNE